MFEGTCYKKLHELHMHVVQAPSQINVIEASALDSCQRSEDMLGKCPLSTFTSDSPTPLTGGQIDGSSSTHLLKLVSSGKHLDMWYKCFGHVNSTMLLHMHEHGTVISMQLSNKVMAAESCEGCALGKIARQPFPH